MSLCVLEEDIFFKHSSSYHKCRETHCIAKTHHELLTDGWIDKRTNRKLNSCIAPCFKQVQYKAGCDNLLELELVVKNFNIMSLASYLLKGCALSPFFAPPPPSNNIFIYLFY